MNVDTKFDDELITNGSKTNVVMSHTRTELGVRELKLD